MISYRSTIGVSKLKKKVVLKKYFLRRFLQEKIADRKREFSFFVNCECFNDRCIVKFKKLNRAFPSLRENISDFFLKERLRIPMEITKLYINCGLYEIGKVSKAELHYRGI